MIDLRKKLDILKKNSQIDLNLMITEDTDVDDIGGFYDSLIMNTIEQSIPKTIAANVCSVQPISFPNGNVLGVKRELDSATNEISIKVANANIKDLYEFKFTSYFTVEAMTDIRSITNSTEMDIFIDASAAESADKIDSVIVPVLRNLAKPIGAGSILLDSPILEAGLQVLYTINLGLAEINVDVKRGLIGTAIVSPTIAAILLSRVLSGNGTAGVTDYDINYTSIPDEVKNAPIGSIRQKNPYYIGKNNNIEFYVDPMAPTDSAIISYKGSIEGESPIIFSPYKYIIGKSYNPATGDLNFYSSVRFGYIRNPLDTGVSNADSDFVRIIQYDCTNVGGGTGGTGGTTVPHAIYNYARDEFTATAGQTDFDVSGSGLLVNVFIDGILLRSNEYTYANPTVSLNEGLSAGTNVVIESFSVA